MQSASASPLGTYGSAFAAVLAVDRGPRGLCVGIDQQRTASAGTATVLPFVCRRGKRYGYRVHAITTGDVGGRYPTRTSADRKILRKGPSRARSTGTRANALPYVPSGEATPILHVLRDGQLSRYPEVLRRRPSLRLGGRRVRANILGPSSCLGVHVKGYTACTRMCGRTASGTYAGLAPSGARVLPSLGVNASNCCRCTISRTRGCLHERG